MKLADISKYIIVHKNPTLSNQFVIVKYLLNRYTQRKTENAQIINFKTHLNIFKLFYSTDNNSVIYLIIN